MVQGLSEKWPNRVDLHQCQVVELRIGWGGWGEEGSRSYAADKTPHGDSAFPCEKPARKTRLRPPFHRSPAALS